MGFTSSAVAQDDADTERARELFDQGVAHVDAGEWDEAAVDFRAALELKDAPAVRYNLASALVGAEEYGEASAMAQALVDDPETPPDLRQRSEELLRQIEEATGTLTVDVSGATRGVTVRIEGEGVPAATVQHRFNLEPRGYTVVVERDGREIERREVTVAAGQSAQLDIAVAPSPADAAAAAAEPGSGDPLQQDDGGDDLVAQWWFWAAIGGAVILTVTLAIVASQ